MAEPFFAAKQFPLLGTVVLLMGNEAQHGAGVSLFEKQRKRDAPGFGRAVI